MVFCCYSMFGSNLLEEFDAAGVRWEIRAAYKNTCVVYVHADDIEKARQLRERAKAVEA